MLAGNLGAILSGGLITIIVSLFGSCRNKATDAHEVWEKTRNIDNPLSPWTEMYAR